MVDRAQGYNREATNPMSFSAKLFPVTSSSPSSPSSQSLPSSYSPGVGFIEHRVSKLDTLAGVAIKYGVEVADIKKMNGLVTDLQMFALKSLQIPLPGRHLPSPCLSNGSSAAGNSGQTSPHQHFDIFDSFQSLKLSSSQRKVSLAMSSLQGYYKLKPSDQKTPFEGSEMAFQKKGRAHCLEDSPFLVPLPSCNPPLSLHRKSRSLANGLDENGEFTDFTDTMHVAEAGECNSDKWKEKLVRRRQKSEADFTSHTPEMLLEDNSGGSGFSAITGKGLALRSKAASRISLAADSEAASGSNVIPTNLIDSLVVDGFFGVRKSSSTSSLQDQDSNNRSTVKRSSKPDLPCMSSGAITRPIFDGLPKPLTGRRNKAALD
ncbi:uncharacterized protein LOC110824331 isoform X2 [Carica papaya]|nr:uncharacterized protein LOC110824331 isoform X2 [Carica papaya]